MKESLSHIARLIGSLLLIVVAIVLTVALAPVALLHLLYITATSEHRTARRILVNIKQFFTNIAASVDQTGNALYGLLWNDLFIKTGSAHYVFGDKDETISEVLGWNQKYHYDSLTRTGRTLIFILDKLEKNHCYIAYQRGVSVASIKHNLYLKYKQIK